MKVDINIHKELSNIIHNELNLKEEDIKEMTLKLVESKVKKYVEEAFRKIPKSKIEELVAYHIKQHVKEALTKYSYGSKSELQKALENYMNEHIKVVIK